jgi:hypothetical protein
VIAPEIDGAETRQRTCRKPVDHLARLRPTVDIVAEENQIIVEARCAARIPGNLAEQAVEQIGPAMDIAHGIDPDPPRNTCRWRIIFL